MAGIAEGVPDPSGPRLRPKVETGDSRFGDVGEFENSDPRERKRDRQAVLPCCGKESGFRML